MVICHHGEVVSCKHFYALAAVMLVNYFDFESLTAHAMIGYCCSGPDSSKIYEIDGYEYLAQNFPNLDYVERCYVVDEIGIDGDYSEGEF